VYIREDSSRINRRNCMRNTKEREKHIQEWKKSGLSKTAYAKQHGINRTTFYRWFRERRTTDDASDGFIEITMNGWKTEDTRTFFGPGVELHLPNGYRLTVSKGFDTETFTTILNLLEVR
jgi:hypothetical protein